MMSLQRLVAILLTLAWLPDSEGQTGDTNDTLTPNSQNASEPEWVFPPNNSNVTRGLRIIAKNTNWYVPYVSDGQSIFKFGIKHSYNKECQSKDDFKNHTAKCLLTHDMFLEDTVSSCRIVVTGNQLAKTYRQIFKNYTLLDHADAHLLTVNTCNNQIAITDFFVFPKSKESTFKFLPYEMAHFRHMLEFDLSLEDPESTKEYVSVDVMNSCLPDVSYVTDTTAESLNNINCTEAKQVNSWFEKNEPGLTDRQSKLSFIQKKKSAERKKVVTEVQEDGCRTSASGQVSCSAAHHLDRSQRHLYMIALYVQVYFIAEYLDENPQDLEVCLVDKMASRHHRRWFWGRLTASSTSKTERFTLLECCSMTRKLKVYDQPSSDQKVSWVCHDPYRVANIILVCVNVGSYIAVLLFPLCVRFLPPLRVTSTHECCSKHKLAKKPHRWSLRRWKRGHGETTPGNQNGGTCCEVDHAHPCNHDNEKSGTSCHHDNDKPQPCQHATDKNTCQQNGEQTSPDQQGKTEQDTTTDTGTKAPLLSLPLPTLHVTTDDDQTSEVSLDALPGGGSRPYVPPHDLLFLDSDPVYSFGFKTILSHILLFHVDNWGLMIVRRFLFLYVMWVLVHFASVIVNFYYPALSAHYQVFYYQVDHFDTGGKTGVDHFYHVFCILVFVVPLCYATIHFSLLSPLLLRKEPISKILSWDDNESHIGSTISMESKYLFYRKSKPCEVSFLMLLRSRMKLWARKQFWSFLFNHAAFDLPKALRHKEKCADKPGRPSSCCNRLCLLGLFYVAKLPIVITMAFIYTVPFFVFHRELFVNPGKFLAPSLRKSNVVRWAVIIMTLSSMLLSFILFLSFSFLYGSMAIFVLVDMIRNIKTNVNHGVLIVSVMLYVQNALVSLEDEYRYMKRTVFHVCKTLDTESQEEAKQGKLRRRPSLVWTSPDGETAIPRRIFTGVCESLMPYTTEIMQTSLALILNLSLVFFLYVLVIDFQALDQFTGIGQSLMTIFTVSLPGLIGKLRSSAALQVDSERRYNRVLASVRDVVHTEDVFTVCPSQVQLTAWDGREELHRRHVPYVDGSPPESPEWV